MNDDPFLDLFALDLPDLTSCAPDLSLAVDLYLGSFFRSAAVALARPVAGGAPGWWDDAWDFIGDIWRGAGDAIEKVGKTLNAIWDRIWSWIGGAIRWLYNQVESFSWWLFHQVEWWGGLAIRAAQDTGSWVWKQVEHWGGVVRDAVTDTAGWVWKQVEHWGGVVRDAVTDTAGWVWKQVEHWGGVVRDKVTDVGDWVWHQVEHWGGVVRDKVTDVGDWVWHQVEHWGGVVRDKVEDTAGWIVQNTVPPIIGAAMDVADVFREAIDRVGEVAREALEAIGDRLADAIKFAWMGTEELIETLERKMAIPGKLVRGQYSDLSQLVDDVMDPIPLVGLGIAAAVLVVVMILSFAVQSALQTYITPNLLPQQQKAIAHAGAALLTVGVVQDALNRGFITEATADDHLSRMGYSGSAKQAILELRNLLPGPSDLIHMAVREVFNPQLRQELTLDAEFPDPFLPWALKLGYTEEWARNYWADHWDLPSPSQGYEMLHRGLIEMPQLINLIKALDYAPVWRQHLIDIAYNPITRVDLRRLYKSGIITEEVVFKGYKAQGYNDENARYLTDYTKQFYSPEDESQLDDMADQAASTFRTAYRRGVITREEALDKIIDAGYAEDVADFLLAIDDAQLALNPTTDAGVAVRDLTVPIIRSAYAEKLWDRARAQAELEVLGYLAWEADLLLQLEDLAQQRELAGLQEAVVKELYLANAIDKAQAGAQLDGYDVLPERRDLLLQRWELAKAQKPKRLTLTQLEKAFGKGIFTESEFLDELSATGYNDRDAKIILDII